MRTVATRYKGKIRYYEIWNEPNLKGFYTGSIDKMLELSREAYLVLKAVDPAIVVVSPSATLPNRSSAQAGIGGPRWLEQYLAKGGGNYADVIGFHFYTGQLELESSLVPLVRQVQTIMARHGQSRKPLWDTELGFGSLEDGLLSDEVGRAYVARSCLVHWALGVSRFYWYAWDNFNFVGLRLVNEDRKTPTAAAQAYIEIQRWLVGAAMPDYRVTLDDTWICRITRPGGYSGWVVWNPHGPTALEIPPAWNVRQVRDLSGQRRPLTAQQLEIGQTPLLLER
ncbi:hypothetical protein H6F94_09465 [Leptolyngbya sp. FACHB-261]|nr:glycosyl hydrolase [Leptolyngbya sp. FACHB-261]MBD2101105.1 hypothetical protein [Leptolyngbya sp. FACHB-261]